MFQLAAVHKSLTATFIARVLTTMDEQPIGVVNRLCYRAKKRFSKIGIKLVFHFNFPKFSHFCEIIFLKILQEIPKNREKNLLLFQIFPNFWETENIFPKVVI